MLKIGGPALAILMLTAGTALAGPPPALYKAAQATAGAAVFTQSCAACHGADMKGEAGPALIGQAFAAAGSGSTIGGVFSTLAQQMPETQPGSLSQTQYEDVMAYILKQNGYPAGATAFAYSSGLTSATPLVSLVK